MKSYVHPHRDGTDLLRAAADHAEQERAGRDLLVVDIAEIDARRVYREAGYPSTVAYCIGELGLSPKASLHRIRVARVAWRLPAILAALVAGRVHLTAVSVLAAHLTEENVEELLEAAAQKNIQDLRRHIAEHFPRRDLFTAPRLPEPLLLNTGPGLMGSAAEPSGPIDDWALPYPPATAPRTERLLKGVQVRETRPVEMPPERLLLKVALERKTHEKLRQAGDLLGHQVPSGDMAEILDRVLDLFIAHAQKRKFAATSKPRALDETAAPQGRHIPAGVKRAVAERDGCQCTFKSASGKRCPARRMLEFDHIEPVARGGQSTVDNLRLRCRTHNQYAAELTYGREFMDAKIEESRRAAAKKRVEGNVLLGCAAPA
jgi:5-methylcytosine-specific restriction endonuclease McrA